MASILVFPIDKFYSASVDKNYLWALSLSQDSLGKLRFYYKIFASYISTKSNFNIADIISRNICRKTCSVFLPVCDLVCVGFYSRITTLEKNILKKKEIWNTIRINNFNGRWTLPWHYVPLLPFVHIFLIQFIIHCIISIAGLSLNCNHWIYLYFIFVWHYLIVYIKTINISNK